MVAGVGPAVSAGPSGTMSMQVDVPAPEGTEGGVREKTRDELSRRVSERLRDRMDAAGVKFATVERLDDGTLKVTVNADVGRKQLEGLVVPAGDFGLSPIQKVGDRWASKSGQIPDGIELRQNGESMDPRDAFLWSSSRSALASFVDEVDLPGSRVFTFAHDGGWRTVTVGEPVVTHKQLATSRIRSVRTGAPYVSLELSTDGQRRFRSHRAGAATEGKFAAILDGEIVAMVDRTALTEGTLNLTAPDQIEGSTALANWARQVAGRLAAPIPVAVVPMDDAEKEE
jgi:preprotein translocase subunit SecD